ncbi:hypothetical protein ES708_33056 [subsurface metagenome]
MAIRKGSVRTQFIGGEAFKIHGQTTPTTQIVDDWIVQDEITIIGCEISVGFECTSEGFALADRLLGIAEVSRAGAPDKDGSIANVALETRWATTVVLVGMDSRKQIVVMLPSGRGIDIDPGEVINLILTHMEEAAQGTYFIASATMYYIER